jgi:hypothetical protein
MGFGYWWALAGLLVVVEIFAPGFFFIWLGISAFVVGGLVWLLPWLGWQPQLLAFAGLSLASVLGWIAWRKRHPPPPTDEPELNRRARQQLGARGRLVGPLENGRGRVRLGDSTWSATGPDLPDGTAVRIVDAQGSRLVVEPAGDVAQPAAGPP